MTTDIQARREYLFICIKEALVEHDVWARETEIAIIPDGRLDVSLTTLFEAFATGDLPGDLREIAAKIAAMATEYASYQLSMASSGRYESSPPDAFAKGMEQLSDLFAAENMEDKPPLETIAELDRQRVGDAQIAEIYCWHRPDGSLDINRVRKQRLENPNLEVPNPLNEQRRLAKQREQRRIAEAIARQNQRESAAAPVAHESIEDLILQGVSAKQICDMKQITMAQLERDCVELGLPTPAESLTLEGEVAKASKQAAQDRRDWQEGYPDRTPRTDFQEDDGELDALGGTLVVDPESSVEDQILQATDTGMNAKEVAELLDVSAAYVETVLSRRAEVVG